MLTWALTFLVFRWHRLRIRLRDRLQNWLRIGFMGSGLVVTLWPRTSGSVSRKQAPSPGSPHASSRPWCNRASSTLIAKPSPVPPDRRTREGSERQNRLNTSFSSPGRSPTP